MIAIRITSSACWILAISQIVFYAPRVNADTVTLTSGAVLRGEILSEDAYEVRLAVSRTSDGKIRTTKIIDRSIVNQLQRSAPDLAVEDDPGGVSTAVSPPSSALKTPDDLRAALLAADQQTATGSYDEATAGYRAVITEAERRGGSTNATTTRLDLLELREEAFTHLEIALEGKVESREEGARAADKAAQLLERRLSQQRSDLGDLERGLEDKPTERRIGNSTKAPSAGIEVRELRERIALGEKRLVAMRDWARNEKVALVSLETELNLAREQSHQAAEDLSRAQRNNRVRH